MNLHPIQAFFHFALLLSGMGSSLASPVVSNVRVSQRAGTNLVDMYYNLSGSGQNGASVSVELSDNSGASYGLPISSLSGHVGSGIANGTNRYLVWNAGTDRPNSFSSTMRLLLSAVDTPPAPEGFSLIPAGSFTMGRTSGDTDDDAPPVSVYVGAFYMAKFEVTKALWDKVATWGLGNGYQDPSNADGKGDNHPVHMITWFDAVKWCNARSEMEGLTAVYTTGGAVMKSGLTAPSANWQANGYRLPTEAEWERAARGGVRGLRFPTGTDSISHSQANYFAYSGQDYDLSGAWNNYHPVYAAGFYPYTSPAGSFAANGYGLYDMAGNVWEWCFDWYGESTYVNGITDPRGAASGLCRVNRGGSWNETALSCRAAYRHHNDPLYSSWDTGLRLVRSSAP